MTSHADKRRYGPGVHRVARGRACISLQLRRGGRSWVCSGVSGSFVHLPHSG
jgi:hypothetical protein